VKNERLKKYNWINTIKKGKKIEKIEWSPWMISNRNPNQFWSNGMQHFSKLPVSDQCRKSLISLLGGNKFLDLNIFAIKMHLKKSKHVFKKTNF